MTATFKELRTALTRGGVASMTTTLLAGLGFPTTAWGETDEPTALVDAHAEGIAGESAKIAAMAKGGTLETAEGPWLDLHARDRFAETRKPAIATQGAPTLTESAGTPHTWDAGELVVIGRTTGRVFRNVAAVTLPASGSVSVTIAAEEPGIAGNVPGETLELGTPVPGVTLSATASDGWITTSGAGAESDDALKERCRLKWGTLASTGSEASYRFAALTSSSEINRVHVQEDPTAAAGSPSVRVIVASTTGAPTPGAFATASAAVEKARPLGVNVVCARAEVSTFSLYGEVRVLAGYRDAAIAAWTTAAADYFATVPIGGTVRIADLYELLLTIPGVVNACFTNSGGVALVPITDDVPLLGDHVARLVDSLTWVSA